MMRNKAKVFLMIFVLLAASFVIPESAEASSARVMISDYQVFGDVVSGDRFKMSLTLKNTAAKTVKNVKLTIYTENGEFYPRVGAGTAYISEIAADSEEEFTFYMMASDGLEEKSYKLSAKIEYDDYYGTEYEVTESVFISVSLERRLTFSDMYYDGVELGETIEITASVNNTGKGTLYNVSAEITGDNVYDQTSYVGNIESGKSRTVDILAKSKKIFEDLEDTNIITISYEDAEGNVTKEEFDIGGLLIEEPQYDNLEKVVTENTESAFETYFKEIAVCVVVVAVIAIYIFFKWRRKKKISEEF